MRILLDLQGAQSPDTRERGIGRYSLGLADAVLRNAGDHEVHLALNAAMPDSVDRIRNRFSGLLPGERIHVFDVLRDLGTSPDDPRRIASEICREAFLAKLDPDIVHISTVVEGMRGDCVSSVGRLPIALPTAATIYDFIPQLRPDQYLVDPAVAEWYRARLEHLRKADLLLAISESTARDAVEQLHADPARVIVIGAGVDPVFRPFVGTGEQRAEFLARLGIMHPFVMYTGGLDPRKNVEGLIRAYAALQPSVRDVHQLVVACACDSRGSKRLREIAEEAGLAQGQLVLTGFVADDDLAQLYSYAQLFVFPSLHEGFGLPLLEAMKCGAAVIASNRSSMPEVVGLEEALFDPEDPQAISDGIAKALTDASYLERLRRHSLRRARMFSWDDVGLRAIRAFEHLHRQRTVELGRRSSAKRKPRLAYVSPLPPARSGIATYSREILPHFARQYEIDIVGDASQMEEGSHCHDGTDAGRVIGSLEFLDRSERYDRVVYHFGNSEFHDSMLSLIDAVPGVVILHDVHLGGLARHRAHRIAGEKGWLATLYRNHGAAAVLDCAESAAPQEAALRYPCCAAIVERALGTIVHSQHARGLIEGWLTPERARRAAQVPLACAAPDRVDRSAARRRLGLSETDRLICSFGLMGPTKLNLELLEAWRTSTAFRDSNCRLVFVGGRATGDYGDALEAAIARYGLESRVEVTGWVEENEYRAYLAASDLAVQLRTGSGGESSRAVLECLSYGIPTIANANGSVQDLPAEALTLLPETFDAGQLREAIDEWHATADDRARGDRGRRFVQSERAPSTIARLYADQIERFYERVPDVVGALAPLSTSLAREEMAPLADIASQSTILPTCRTVHLDVSELADSSIPDRKRRLLRQAARQLARIFPKPWRLNLISFDDNLGRYVHDQACLAQVIGLKAPLLPSEPVDFSSEDIVLCMDSRQGSVVSRASTIEQLYRWGLHLHFLIDDLRDPASQSLPAEQISETFVAWLMLVARSGGIICSSVALRDELQTCLAAIGVEIQYSGLGVVADWLMRAGAAKGDPMPMREILSRATRLWDESGNGAEERLMAKVAAAAKAELL